jgi:hypothetical protein
LKNINIININRVRQATPRLHTYACGGGFVLGGILVENDGAGNDVRGAAGAGALR